MDPVMAPFIKEGLLGAIIVVLFFVAKSRDTSYRDVQEKRIIESREITERVLAAMSANTDATRAARTGFSNMIKLMEEIKDRMPTSGRRLK